MPPTLRRTKGYCYFIVFCISSVKISSCSPVEQLSKDLFEFVRPEALYLKTIRFGKKSSFKAETKTILVFTTLFGKQEWPNLVAVDSDNFLKKHGCPVSNCRLTYNKGDGNIDDADIVVFHDRDMPDPFTLKSISESKRPNNQIWVYFTGENPLHSHHNVGYLDNLFDWTMTYKHSSDIWLPYFRYYPFKEANKTLHTDYAKTKKGLIAWLASDCGKMRERVVHELQQILPVQVGGHCSVRFSNKLDCLNDEECNAKIRRFKFYLAFENALCDDYVTEKYWYRAIKNGVVPIVLGGGPYDDPKVAIPGSYINALDFENVDKLADYIKYLDKNDTAYNEYFSWKNHHSLWTPTCDWPFEPYWACQMCLRLNIGIQKKQRISMSRFWSVSRNCDKHNRRLELFLKDSGHDFQAFERMHRGDTNPFNEVSKEMDYEEERRDRMESSEPDTSDLVTESGSRGEDEISSHSLVHDGDTETEEYTIILLFSISVTGFVIFMFRIRSRSRA